MRALEIILLLLIFITITAIVYVSWDNLSSAHFGQAGERLRFIFNGIY
jgi:hypothetical protein